MPVHYQKETGRRMFLGLMVQRIPKLNQRKEIFKYFSLNNPCAAAQKFNVKPSSYEKPFKA
jgi:hypothetical protein